AVVISLFPVATNVEILESSRRVGTGPARHGAHAIGQGDGVIGIDHAIEIQIRNLLGKHCVVVRHAVQTHLVGGVVVQCPGHDTRRSVIVGTLRFLANLLTAHDGPRAGSGDAADVDHGAGVGTGVTR